MANNIDINKLVGDVAALNKQITETSALLSQLITKQGTLNKELGGAKGLKQSQDALNKSKKTGNEIEKVGNSLLAQKNKAVAAQDKSLRKLTIETIKQKEALRQQNKALRDGAIGKRTTLFGSMTKSIISATVAMVGFRTVMNVFKNSLKTIADFEQAMSKVRAVTNALPREFKQLNDNAKLLGSTTSKTAREVAGLQLEFAKLGFSTTEILAATEATISLSIAAGSDLANSAVVAASTLRGFGLNASETQRVVDVMAKSFASSALDLEKFKTSMAAVAPVAKANGKDIEFVTARLSVLSDAGLDASTSGTSLRNMFLELSKKGLTWEQGLEKINSSTDKNVTALDLFGKRGATAGLILADNIEKAQGLEKAYDGAAGSALEMATIMEDNLIGDTNKLSSAWEGFILGLNKGEGTISNVFRGLVKWLTDVVNMFNMANKSYQELVDQAQSQTLKDAIAGDADEVKIIAESLGDYSRAVKLMIKQLEGLRDVDGEENELLDSRIFALKSLIADTKDASKVIDDNTNSLKGNAAELDKILEIRADPANSGYVTFLEMASELEEETNNEILDGINKVDEAREKAADDEIRLAQMVHDRKIQLLYDSFAVGATIGNALFEIGQSNRDKELMAVEQDFAMRIEQAEGNAEQQKQLEEQLAVEQRRIAHEAAIAQRNQRLFNIGINAVEKGFDITASALAVTAAATLNPLLAPLIPLAWAQLGLLGAATGAQTAAALSMPIPGFFTGTENAPAGLAHIAEHGRELIESNGQFTLADKPQLMNLQGGETVHNNRDTERMLNAAIYKDIAVNGNEGMESRMDTMIGKLDTLKQVNVNLDADGFNMFTQKGNSITHYLNRKTNR